MTEGPTGAASGPPGPQDGPPPPPPPPPPATQPAASAPRWGQYAPTPPPEPAQPAQPAQPTGWGQQPAWGQPGQQPGWGQPGQQAGWNQPAPQAPIPGQPQHGQYGQYGTTPPAYGGGPWAPPAPRPGIVPLRPLSLGEIFDGAFRAIRTNPKVMFGLSAIVVTITAVIEAVITWRVFATLEPVLTVPVVGEEAALAELDAALSDLLSQLGLILGATAISFVVTTLLSGLLIVSVSQSVIGRTIGPAEVWASARGQLGRLLLLTLLLVVIVAAPFAIWAGLTGAALVGEQWAVATFVGLAGGLLAVVATVILVTRTLLATPALMLERATVLESLRRGWRLTRSSFWRVFGIYLLTSLLVAIVAGAISSSVSLVLQLTATDPMAVLVSPAYIIGSTLAQIVATTLTTPFSAGVTALLYIDVRMRTEGLDIELARAAEQG